MKSACYGKVNGPARKNYGDYVKPNAKLKKNSAEPTSSSFGHLPLDNWTENRHSEFYDNRNSLVHGGKIQADVKTIRLFSSRQPDHVAKWKTVFQMSCVM